MTDHAPKRTVDLQKNSPGGALGYFWAEAGAVVAVAERHVHELVTASHGEIHRVAAAVEAEVEAIEAQVKKTTKRAPKVAPVPTPSGDLGDALSAAMGR
jgi:hypothetical protein